MSRLRPIFSNFTAGELTPLLDCRLDYAKYANGAKVAENWIIRPHGPLVRRAGLRWTSKIKDSANQSRLIRFKFSIEQSYVIDFGHLYFRFYRDGGLIVDGVLRAITDVTDSAGLIRVTSVAHGLTNGQGVDVQGVLGVPLANGTWIVANVAANTFDLTGSTFAGTYVSGGIAQLIIEVAHTYDVAQLFDVDYFQDADTLYLCHPAHPVRKLIRLSHTSWQLKDIVFLPPATQEDGTIIAATLTLSATSGLAVTLTSSVAVFLEADVGRMVTVPGVDGRAIIISIPGAGPQLTATASVVTTFASVGPHTPWLFNGSPTSTLTPTPVAPNTVTQLHAIIPLVLATNGWRLNDLGRYVRVNNGVCRITEVVTGLTVNAEILFELDNATASPAGSWSLESESWSASYGYPHTGTFHEQRMILASTTGTGLGARPQTIWGSRSGDPESFPFSARDNGAFEFAIASQQVNVVRWLVPTRLLLIGTEDGELRMTGGGPDKPITPTSVDVKSETGYGSSKVNPIKVNNAALHISRSGKELREYVYNFGSDSYVDNDLLLLSSHMTENFTLKDMDYQRTPHSIVWLTTEEGKVLSLTYQREHEIAGWTRHLTGYPTALDTETGYSHPFKGFFESVVVIPSIDGRSDTVWFSIRRVNADGVTFTRSIEYIDEDGGTYYSQSPGLTRRALFVDSGLTFQAEPPVYTLTLSGIEGIVTATTSGSVFTSDMVGDEIREKGSDNGLPLLPTIGSATILSVGGPTVATVQIITPFTNVVTASPNWLIAVRSVLGLNHLIGQTVDILGDGAVYTRQTVASDGSVTVAEGEPPFEVADVGIPYVSYLKTMRVEAPTGGGTSQGLQKVWSEVIVRMRHSLGGNIMGEALPSRKVEDAMDTPPPIFNGDLVKTGSDVDTDGYITIYQDEPLPMTVVGIFGTIGVGG